MSFSPRNYKGKKPRLTSNHLEQWGRPAQTFRLHQCVLPFPLSQRGFIHLHLSLWMSLGSQAPACSNLLLWSNPTAQWQGPSAVPIPPLPMEFVVKGRRHRCFREEGAKQNRLPLGCLSHTGFWRIKKEEQLFEQKINRVSPEFFKGEQIKKKKEKEKFYFKF